MSEVAEPGAISAQQSDAARHLADGAAAPEVLPCGARLRVAREQKGMSLGDVAQRLKYAVRQVQALEENNYRALPGLTFQRGFVRGYAKLVGLEPGDLVAQLEREAGRDNGPTTAQLQQITYAPAVMPSPSEGTSAWPWILGMLLAVTGIGGYMLYQWDAPVRPGSTQLGPGGPPADSGSRSGHSAPPAAAQAVETLPLALPSGSANADERAIPMPQPGVEVVPPGSSADSTRAAEAAGAAPAVSGAIVTPATVTSGKIHLSFTGESWVEVRQGNGTLVYSGVNRNGSEQWVDGQPPFDLVVGNARVVKLNYRGAEINLEPYTKVTVARLQLK